MLSPIVPLEESCLFKRLHVGDRWEERTKQRFLYLFTSLLLNSDEAQGGRQAVEHLASQEDGCVENWGPGSRLREHVRALRADAESLFPATGAAVESPSFSPVLLRAPLPSPRPWAGCAWSRASRTRALFTLGRRVERGMRCEVRKKVLRLVQVLETRGSEGGW